MPMTEAEVFEKVQEQLVDALGVDDDEVELDKTLTRDLGAESIDFLDIVFRLEKAFGIKIPQGDPFPSNLLKDPQIVADGKITETGLATLKEKLPHMDFSRFESDPDVDRLPELFTVKAICAYVGSKVNA